EEENEHVEDCITIQTGIMIRDCQKKLIEFCKKDASYRRYDLEKVEQDNELTREDVQLGNRMVARMGPLVIESVISRTTMINLVLEHIAPGTGISDKHVPWLAIEQLFSATLGPEVGPARATKILHKKRPALIPILDSVVLSYCKVAWSDDLRSESEASKMTAYVKVIKIDVDNNLDVLENIIQASALKLTPVRAFDILLWGYSGEYERNFGRPPVWKR
ncbi:unnamed protein product, partial [marine sediment metagenome]